MSFEGFSVVDMKAQPTEKKAFKSFQEFKTTTAWNVCFPFRKTFKLNLTPSFSYLCFFAVSSGTVERCLCRIFTIREQKKEEGVSGKEEEQTSCRQTLKF